MFGGVAFAQAPFATFAAPTVRRDLVLVPDRIRTGWSAGRLMPMRTTSTDTRYVKLPIDATVVGTYFDPTTLPVAFAFMPLTNPATSPGPSDWVTSTWEMWPGPQPVAICLVGPGTGGKVLAVGDWDVSVRITSNPEIPVLKVGIVTVVP